MNFNFDVLILKILILLLFAPNANLWAAQSTHSPSILLNADSYKSHPNQTADLSGNVKIVRGDEVMKCDKAFVNNATGDVIAEGNVIFLTKKDYIRAQRLTYNFISKTGEIYQGIIQTGQETIEGEKILKTGESQYLAESATYTSCINCPPSWKISGSKIDATVGGYAYVSQPVVKLYNIPVLWLPWIAIPIKTERQSGFLPPSFSNSATKGSSFGESYFWDLGPSKDATFYLTYYDVRGFKEGIEYRFVSSKTSSGIFQASLLNDRRFPNSDEYRLMDNRYVQSSTRTEIPTELTRFGIRYKHHVELPEGFSNNIQINAVRDTRYLYDFPLEMPGAGDPALESRLSLTRNTENTHTSLDVDLYQNLLVADPTGQNTTAVHRVPDFKFSVLPQKILKYGRLGLDMNYSNFMGASQTFYDPQNRSTFTTGTAGSQYRTGQRIIFHPSLAIPFNLLDVLDFEWRTEFDEANYQFGYSPSPSATRRYVRSTLDLKTRLSAIINEADMSPSAVKYKHEFIPELAYTVVPIFEQERHPFFLGTSGQTFQPNYISNQPITEYDNLQFDYKDRLVDRNLITYGFTNKFIRRRPLYVPPPKNDAGNFKQAPVPGVYKEIIRHSVSQSFDISSETLPNLVPNSNGSLVAPVKQPYSDIHSLLTVSLDYFTLNSELNYYPYENKSNSAQSVALTNSYGDGFSLGFAQGYQVYPNYTDPSSSPLRFASLSESVTGSVFFKTKRLNMTAKIAYDILQRRWSSYEVATLIKPPGECWGISFGISQIFGGDRVYVWSLPIFFGEGKSFDAQNKASSF